MTVWMLNDILQRWGQKRAHVLHLVFLRARVGYCNASITLIFGGFGIPLKNGGETDCCTRLIVVVQEGFGHYTDQNTPFKRWKQMGKALDDSFQMDWALEGSKQRTIVPGQNTAFSSKRRPFRVSATDK